MNDTNKVKLPLAKYVVVDLDGTLVKSDCLEEQILLYIKQSLFGLMEVFFWLLQGKVVLKQKLFERVGDELNVENLPYNESVILFIQDCLAAGKIVSIASGSHKEIVNKIGDYLSIDGPHFGTEKDLNLTSHNKATKLKAVYPVGFAYVGNSSSDLAVWKESDEAYSVPISSTLRKKASELEIDLISIGTNTSKLKPIVKAMRFHQWAKNGLIFTIPLITFPASGMIDLLQTVIGFLLLGVIASGTYIINDLFDIEADRKHPSKKNRPFASGSWSLSQGAGIAILLVVGSLISAWFLSPLFCLTLVGYLAITLCYSFYLKSKPIQDVFCLAFLFSIRVVAGGAILNIAPTPWLMAFVFFFFLSLAITKRYIEIRRYEDLIPSEEWNSNIPGRGYRINDGNYVLAAGLAAAAEALTVFFIYSLSVDLTLFSVPWMALLSGFLLAYWLLRIWLLAARGTLNDDPVLFAVKDYQSLLIGSLIFLGLVI